MGDVCSSVTPTSFGQHFTMPDNKQSPHRILENMAVPSTCNTPCTISEVLNCGQLHPIFPHSLDNGMLYLYHAPE